MARVREDNRRSASAKDGRHYLKGGTTPTAVEIIPGINA